MTTKSQRENDLITFKASKFIKDWNKDMIPKFEELESMTFKGHNKANNYVLEHFGSSAYTYLTIFINGEKSSYWGLKV